MKFFCLKIKSQPAIRFACAVTQNITDMKKNIIDNRKNLFEFGINTDVILDDKINGESFTVYPHDIFISFPENKYILTAKNADYKNTTNTLYSIAVEIDDYFLRFCDSENKEDMEFAESIKDDREFLIIPLIFSMDENEYQSILLYTRTLINHFFLGTSSSYHMCICLWYQIMALLDSFIRLKLYGNSNIKKTQNPGEAFYVQKAKNYISAHFCEHITIDKIAKSVNLSPNYLSVIFKKTTGNTIINYVNSLRVLKIRELLLQNNKITLSDICSQIGISDTRYVQRLFKKHFGVSMRRYLQLENGITLLHENPWVKENLETDIYNIN